MRALINMNQSYGTAHLTEALTREEVAVLTKVLANSRLVTSNQYTSNIQLQWAEESTIDIRLYRNNSPLLPDKHLEDYAAEANADEKPAV